MKESSNTFSDADNPPTYVCEKNCANSSNIEYVDNIWPSNRDNHKLKKKPSLLGLKFAWFDIDINGLSTLAEFESFRFDFNLVH